MTGTWDFDAWVREVEKRGTKARIIVCETPEDFEREIRAWAVSEDREDR